MISPEITDLMKQAFTGVVEIVPKSEPEKNSELFSFFPFFGII